MSLPADVIRQLQQLFREQAHQMRQIARDAVTQAFGGRFNGGKLDGDAVLAATTTPTLGVGQPDNKTITIDTNGTYSALTGQFPTINMDQLGSVAATASGGTTISGLTVGNTYALQSTAGPWVYITASGYTAYSWSASVDGGSTWQTVLNYTVTPSPVGPTVTTPAWAISAAQTDGNHARVVFVATGTSILFRCQDSTYTDNSGSLGWELLDITYEPSSIMVEHGGTKVATRPIINPIDSASVTWTVADNSSNDRVDLTAAVVTGASGGIATNPMTTQDDIIVAGASGTPTRLGKGSDGQVLTVNATTHHVDWETPGTGLTNPMTAVDDLIIGGTVSGGVAAPARLAVGSAGQFVGADPSSGHVAYQTLAGGTGISVTQAAGTTTIAASGSGGGGTALTQLSLQVLSGAAATVSFTSIPGTYSGLRLVITGRTTSASEGNVIGTFNSDSAAHYNWVANRVINTSGSYYDAGTVTGGASSAVFGEGVPASGATAGEASSMEILIPFYAGTTFWKQWLSTNYRGSTVGMIASFLAGNWASTAAITRIDLSLNNGNWVTGSSFVLYGMS